MHMTPYQPIEVAERTLSTSASTLDRWHSLAVEVAASEVRGELPPFAGQSSLGERKAFVFGSHLLHHD